jgi:hypothetical protein
MVLIAFSTMDWDFGLRRIQEKFEKYTILAMMGLYRSEKGLIIRFLLIVTC